MSEHREPIPSMIYNAAVGGHVTNSQQIIDENINREQSDVNQEVLFGEPYNSTTPNGMGRIILKKNDNFKQVVEAQTDGNTIFVIKYDFTLTGNVTVPENCVLEFDGGSLSGSHIITLNRTEVIGHVKFVNCSFAGTFSNKWIHGKWFSTTIADKSALLNNLLSIHKFIDFDDISYETYDTVIVYTYSNIRNLHIDNKDTNTAHSVISVTPDGGGAILNIDGLFISAENALEIGVNFGLIRYSRFNNLDIQGSFRYALLISQVFVSSLSNCRIARFREKGIYIPSGHFSTSFDINHVYFINGRGMAIDIDFLAYSSFKGIYCDHHDGNVEGRGGIYINLDHAYAVSIESVGCEDCSFYCVFSFVDNSYVTINNCSLSFAFKATGTTETYIVFGSRYTKCSNFMIDITGFGSNYYKRGLWSGEGEILSENITNDGELDDTQGNTLLNRNHYNINKLIKLIPTS